MAAHRFGARRPPRRARPARVDAVTIGDPWRRFVQDARSGPARFHRALDRVEPGPLRDALTDVAGRVDRGVEETFQIARRGDALDAAVTELRADTIRWQLGQVDHELASGATGSELPATRDALASQLASA